MERKSGILLAISSLPSSYGIGDFGKEAYRFVDDLKKGGFKIWQILPMNPLGFGNSPYQPYSSKAMDSIYISIEMLKEEGLIKKDTKFNQDASKVDYEAVREFKDRVIHRAYSNFKVKGDFKEFDRFVKRNPWLENFAVFATLKKVNYLKMRTEWPEDHKNRITDHKAKLGHYKDQIQFEKWCQFVLFTQWEALKKYANANSIEIVGDIPFYVGMDSVDVWENQSSFLLNSVDRNPTHIAGVPPDYFSSLGQRWGNPIYNWEVIANKGFKFWIDRIGFNAQIFDIIRIDHFRAFDTYWKIPSSCPTAVEGEWIKAPGYAFFDALYQTYPDIKIIAEDLGDLFDSVLVLRDHYNLPGMNVLEFTFEPFKEEYGTKDKENMVVYTGTHDNETVNGWIDRISDNERNAIRRKLENLGFSYPDFAYSFVRLALANKAYLSIIPMQDILSLGNEARMNVPSTIGSPNWEYKMSSFDDFESRLEELRDLNKMYNR